MYPGYRHNKLEEDVFDFPSRGLVMIIWTLKESEGCVGGRIMKESVSERV